MIKIKKKTTERKTSMMFGKKYKFFKAILSEISMLKVACALTLSLVNLEEINTRERRKKNYYEAFEEEK